MIKNDNLRILMLNCVNCIQIGVCDNAHKSNLIIILDIISTILMWYINTLR